MAKIMLVEDDNNLRAIYGDRLLAEGHEIVSAKDGEEALAVAVKEKPELIISDVMMPKISGFDMLDILRSTPETAHTKVIMMTALSQAEDKERANTLGADKYLVKSQVTLDDVARVVDEVLNGTSAAPTDPLPAGLTSASTMATAPVTEPAAAVPEPVVAEPVAAPVVVTAPVETPAEPTPAVAAPVATPPTPDPVVIEEPLVAVAPEPVVAEPVAAPVVVTAPVETPAVADADPISSNEEQAIVSDQIDQFIATNMPDTPTHEAPVVDEPAAAPPTQVVEEPAVTAASVVEATMEPAPAPAAPSNGQKVIEPLEEQTNKPDIHDLFEKEMAAEAAQVPVQNPGAGSVLSTSPPQDPNDPNNISL
jgi:CheY-like chemotaxis protein